MSVSRPIQLSASHSAPFYLFSLRSASISYWNLPFPANSVHEAVARIRHSVNSPDFDASGLDDLKLYCVGSFDSVKNSPGKFFKTPELVLGDLRSLLVPKDGVQ